jgi:hypothetical protein
MDLAILFKAWNALDVMMYFDIMNIVEFSEMETPGSFV